MILNLRHRVFVASKDWFDKFKKRFSLRSVPLHGKAASADTAAVQRYIEEAFSWLNRTTFNINETGMFWMRMVSCMLLFKNRVKRSGFEAHKDCVALIMCGNDAGFMMKPGLSYKSKTHVP